MQGINIAALVIGSLSIFGFLILYGFGARWWGNPIGWLLMGQGLAIAAGYTKALVAVFTGVYDHLHDTTPYVVSNIVAAVYMVAQFAVFVYLITKARGKKENAE